MEKVELSLEEYVKKYYEEVKEDIPELIKYVDLILDEIFYYSQLYSIHEDKFKRYDYHTKIDSLEVFEVCSEILESLNPIYSELYRDALMNKDIVYTSKKKDISCMNNKTKIKIKKTSTIEDIMATIHEFFHRIHISKFNNKLDDHNWYFPTEMIATIFELYALFYLYKQDRYRDDLKVYFNKLFDSIYGRGASIAHETLLLDIYDHCHSIDDDKIEEFRQHKQMSKEMIKILDVFLNDDADFNYHEEATYVFGYPIGLYVGLLMAYDHDYLEQVMRNFEHINNMSIEEFLKQLNISAIVKDKKGDYLFEMVENINQFFDCINAGKVKGKELIIGG